MIFRTRPSGHRLSRNLHGLQHGVAGDGFAIELGGLGEEAGVEVQADLAEYLGAGKVVAAGSGREALASILYVGKRKVVENVAHNIPLVALGTGLLWFGWYGFNADSELRVDSVTASAFLNTDVAASFAAATWLMVEWMNAKQPKFVGLLTGAVAGLATITPAAGYVSLGTAAIIGILAVVNITGRLPTQPLDGELWLARGRFEALSGFVRKLQPDDDEWRQIKFLVFELPDAPGPFSERARRIQDIIAELQWPQLVAVPQYRVKDRDELMGKLDEVLRGGGEGLMLHLADAPYTTGRSDVLLKLKPLSDTEAVVVEQIPGKGKYKGLLGALRVQMPDGKRFVIGSGFTDAARQHPPAVGTLITYTYQGLTRKGLPRFASYLRVRETF